jgi:hypothetical protein
MGYDHLFIILCFRKAEQNVLEMFTAVVRLSWAPRTSFAAVIYCALKGVREKGVTFNVKAANVIYDVL